MAKVEKIKLTSDGCYLELTCWITSYQRLPHFGFLDWDYVVIHSEDSVDHQGNKQVIGPGWLIGEIY